MKSYQSRINRFRIRVSIIWAIFLVVSCWIFMSVAIAGEYPSKPIRLIYPFPAGSSGDIASRLLADEASKVLGVVIPVTNVAGGDGTIGGAEVAHAKPDGYTLGSLTPTAAIYQPFFSKLTYETSDFLPICQFTLLPILLVSNAERPFKTAAEFVEYAKKHEGELVAGHPGDRSGPHLSLMAFLDTFGIKMKIIPFKGIAPSLASCVGGHVDIVPASLAATIPYRDAGKLRILVLFAKERVKILPDVPVVGELGVKMFPQIWTGLFAPKGTPEEILQKLYKAFGQAAQSETFLEKMAKIKQPAEFLDHKDFAERIASDIEFIRDFSAKHKK
jgi:tripartite-type tricarboxylate transporter receptor subunit TctC